MFAPEWLITRSAFSYSVCREGLNCQISTCMLSICNERPEAPTDAARSKLDFPHWTIRWVYPFRLRQQSIGFERIAWMSESNCVEPTVTKASIVTCQTWLSRPPTQVPSALTHYHNLTLILEQITSIWFFHSRTWFSKTPQQQSR
jgi:hypothetical protein